ncbi:MAG TPA: UvrD-helicase domain-containing protein [Microlunatus sp.]|nr:UvrD-helicase domain-containing protein [Microlunatus sp.]
MAPAPTPFDVEGPLPTGTTVLEASAGTGKTYTIAALAARYVAEGHAELHQLMIVTFGRMATDELRVRVRDRLVRLEAQLTEALGRTLPGTPVPPRDAVADLLLDVDATELARRHERVSRALADFDAATIATTHEFCLRMLDDLGVLGDPEPDAVFVEHLVELTSEVARDVYLRRYATEAEPLLKFEDALRLAEEVIRAGPIRLVPELGSGARADERVGFAREVVDEVRRRKERARYLTYDDMLTRLRDALADPQYGDLAAQRLRDRFPVVLVDEFQDTDPIQWDILRRAFHQHSTLVVIGDPKQAIYAFRGADVNSYLQVARESTTIATLGTCYRSDRALLDGLDLIMGDASLGDPAIVVRPVGSAHPVRRLTDAGAPVRVRVLPPKEDGEQEYVNRLRRRITKDLVAEIAALLGPGDAGSGARLSLDGREPRPVQASDLAVLVRRNVAGEQIRDALAAAGIPAVLHGSDSVFSSVAARDWLRVLQALEQPRQALVREAALTSLVGWTFPRLALADEAALADLSYDFRRWSRTLAFRGVAALLETMGTDTALSERVLSRPDGERLLTDLRHVAQRLHALMTGRQLGVAGLREWLAEAIEVAVTDDVTEGLRRLATDAAAVQVLTLHRSKGLEFPVVYLPEAWDCFVPADERDAVLRLHEDGTEVLDVGGRQAAGRPERFRRSLAEEAGENLRLTYVGMTRAQCQVVTWWADARTTTTSALHRFWARPARVGDPDPSYPSTMGPAQEPIPRSAALLVGDPGRVLSVEQVQSRPTTRRRAGTSVPVALAARGFERALDTAWRRTSYSSLTAAAHGTIPAAGVSSEPEPLKEDDESVARPAALPAPDELASVDDPALDLLSPMRDLPSGVDFGTAVHAVLEVLDPTADDLAAATLAATTEALSRLPHGDLTPERLAEALLPSLATPLGPLADDRSLAELSPADRLCELVFELPLAGGDRPRADVRLGDLAPLLARHLPSADPLAGYPALLSQPPLADEPLKGYLTGSIDAVLRVGPAAERRYLVVDYKTNWLGRGEPGELTVADYAPPAMAAAMQAAHYPLQALLYEVALHRMLRWRLSAYDPARHLGGALYLFLRGMAGPETPRVAGVPHGVFSWRPPSTLITELSDLLDRGPG